MKHKRSNLIGACVAVFAVFAVFILVVFGLLGCSGGGGGSPVAPDSPAQTERQSQLDPTSPWGLTAYGLDQAIQLDWEPPSEEPEYPYGYNIYRSEESTVLYENPEGEFHPQPEEKVAEMGLVKINDEPVASTHYLDTPLENGETFYYRVRIVQTGPGNVNEKNHWSNEASATAGVGPIEGPDSLDEYSFGDYSIEIYDDGTITYEWSVSPPTGGRFTESNLPAACFQAAGVHSDTTVEIQVVVSSDSFGPVSVTTTVKVKDVIKTALNLREIDFLPMTLVGVKGDTYIFDYDGPPPDISVGDIIVGSDGLGYLRWVDQIQDTGSSLIMETSQATLGDAIVEGTLSATLDFSGSHSGEAYRSANGIIDETLIFPPLAVNLLDFLPDGILYEDPDGIIRLQLQEGLLEWTPSINFYADYTELPPGLNTLRTSAIGELYLGLDVLATAQGEYTDEDEHEIYTQYIPIPGFPVPLWLEVSFVAGWEVAAHASGYAEAGLTYTNRVELGFEYDRVTCPEWCLINEYDETFDTFVDGQADGEITARVYIRPEVAFVIAGIVSTGIDAEPYLELDASAYIDPPDWCFEYDIYAGLTSNAFVNVTVLWWELFDVRWELLHLRWNLCDEIPEIGWPGLDCTPMGPCGEIQPPELGPWPMYHHDVQHTGRSEYVGPQTSAAKWKFDVGAAIDCSPVMGQDGTIYFGTADDNLYALDPDGSFKWAFPAPGAVSIFSTPAIAADGTVYFGGSKTNNVYALNPDGSLKWEYPAGSNIDSSPVIGAGGMVYIHSDDRYLYAINPDGSLGWRYFTGGQQHSSPAIGDDGTIYIGENQTMWAINPDGTLKWEYGLPHHVNSSPAIAEDGTIYFGCYDYNLYALTDLGSSAVVKWTYPTDYTIANSTPAIAEDGTVYVGSEDHYLHAVDPDGSFLWKYETGDCIFSSPAVGADGLIYVGSRDGYVYALNPDGTLKWQYLTGGYVYSSPAIGNDGTLYTGSDDGYLYAFNDSGVPPEESWARTWGGAGADNARSCAVDNLSNTYITGSFSSTVDFDPGGGVDGRSSAGGTDVFLCKYDGSMDYQWVRTWGGSAGDDQGLDVTVDDAGDVYVTGRFYGNVDFDPGSGVDEFTSNGNSDIFLSKFDSAGTYQWAKIWGGSGDDYGHGVGVDGLDHIYVAGSFESTVDFDPGAGTDYHTSHGIKDIFLSKFSPSGTFQWAKTWGGSNDDGAYALAVDSYGVSYVTGQFIGNIDFDPGPGSEYHGANGYYDVYLSKLDSSGVFQWAKTWGGSSSDGGNGVTVDSLGDVYITGWFAGSVDFDPGGGVESHSSNGERDAFLSKFDSSGFFYWARTWGGAGRDFGNGVAVDNSGVPHVGGFFHSTVDFDPGPGVDSHSSHGLSDAYLSKFSSSGEFQWARSWGGPEDDNNYGVGCDALGNIYSVDGFGGTVDFDPGPGVDEHSSNGGQDAYLVRLLPNGYWE